MSDKLPDGDAWIDAVAPIVRLKIDAEARPGVKANLEVAMKMAALLDRMTLPDEAEPAPVYRA